MFDGQLGKLKGAKVNVPIDPDANPKFVKARTVPYSMKEGVEKALVKLQESGIISPVRHSKWASPIVPVVKPDGSTRICGDFKSTINQASSGDPYPLPTAEELFAKLAGGKFFSKLDLSQAFLQLELDDKSKEFAVISTHKGLFRFNRLPYGVSASPGIFQRTLENVLQGCEGVCVYIDDILVTGSTATRGTKWNRSRSHRTLVVQSEVAQWEPGSSTCGQHPTQRVHERPSKRHVQRECTRPSAGGRGGTSKQRGQPR